MYNLNEYSLCVFNTNKNRGVYAELLSEYSRITVESEIFSEDGEDPLVRSRVYIEPFRSMEGSSGTVYVHPDEGRITIKSVYEAIQEFMSGGY